jgi:hypothetical protein
LLLVVVVLLLLFVVDDEKEFRFTEEDSSSDPGLDFAASEFVVVVAVEDADEEDEVEPVSEIFPNVVDPVFQLGVCFFQAG